MDSNCEGREMDRASQEQFHPLSMDPVWTTRFCTVQHSVRTMAERGRSRTRSGAHDRVLCPPTMAACLPASEEWTVQVAVTKGKYFRMCLPGEVAGNGWQNCNKSICSEAVFHGGQ